MTNEDDAPTDEPHPDREPTDPVLEKAAEWLAEIVSFDTGIHLDPTLEVDGPVVRWVHRGTELCSVSLDSSSTNGGAISGRDLGERLLERAAYSDLDALKGRLVDIELDYLRAKYLDDVEEVFRARLDEEDLESIGEVDLDFVELGYHYHHGDPPEVYELGYPPFGLEVWCWDPELEVAVEFGRWPGDVDDLAEEAVKRFLQEVADR